MDYAFCSENIQDLSKALIEVQKNLQPAIKDASNPFCKNRYATLNSVMESCRDALLNNGIMLTQYPVPVAGDNLGLVTKLVHAETGQYQASIAVIPLAKCDPQAMGSAFTYGRRYALSAMLGIITEEDDDGNSSSSPKVGKPGKVKPTPPARTALSRLLEELGIGDLSNSYRAWLRSKYNCSPEALTSEQYEEQKSMLEKCKAEPIRLRNLLRTLHEYK